MLDAVLPKSSKYWEENWVPLSETSVSGNPNMLKKFSSSRVVADDVVDFISTISGQRE